jgi:hypothetical protein
MAIGGMHLVAHKKSWNFPLNDTRYPVGSVFKVEGDSAEMWLHDYNVRVCTHAEILEQPLTTDKKVLVCLNSIDHDSMVAVRIRKTALKKEARIK